jgi:hypothetical protein
MTEAEILREARAKIEKGWCQGYYARDKDGNQTSYDNPNAEAFCSSGAVWSFCSDTVSAHQCSYAGSFLSEALDDPRITFVHWQDQPGRTKEEVLALFDKAIALAEA